MKLRQCYTGVYTFIYDPSISFFFPFPTRPFADLGISISMPQLRFGPFDVALLEEGVLTAGGVLAGGGVFADGVALLDGGVARVLLSSFELSLPLPCGRW